MTVKVKWGKENYPNVELNTEELPLLFKAQLFALTGVQPERQKVMIKGKIVTDDSWEGFPIKDGAQLLMMGAVDEIPEAPKEKISFMEDMTDSELNQALELPAGLSNLGNTCYLNATIQCLKTVKELRESLKNYSGHLTLSEAEGPHNITVALRDALDSMDKQATVTPIILIQVLHMIFPRFAEKNDHGTFMQQDANECWIELMRMLQQKLPPIKTSSSGTNNSRFMSFIDQYFGGRFKVTMKNNEDEEEPETHTTEDFLQLSCFISQGLYCFLKFLSFRETSRDWPVLFSHYLDLDVKYLQSGLRSRLQESITKLSPKLGRDAVYTKSCRISRLPAYLSIQFVRFQFKEKSATNAKILKDIKFTISLDAFELCSPDLQNKLLPMRELFKAADDRAVEEAVKNKGQAKKKDTRPKKVYPSFFEDDPGSNNSGFYELQAVLTHKGRSSNSGHYLGWVRGKEGEWFKCDDEDVTLVTEEEVLKLSGGGQSLIMFIHVCHPIIPSSFSTRLFTSITIMSRLGENDVYKGYIFSLCLLSMYHFSFSSVILCVVLFHFITHCLPFFFLSVFFSSPLIASFLHVCFLWLRWKWLLTGVIDRQGTGILLMFYCMDPGS